MRELTCGRCGGAIRNLEDGLVVWVQWGDHGPPKLFDVVHDHGCDDLRHGLAMPLVDAAGPTGLDRLLDFLDCDGVDGASLARVIRLLWCDGSDDDHYGRFAPVEARRPKAGKRTRTKNRQTKNGVHSLLVVDGGKSR